MKNNTIIIIAIIAVAFLVGAQLWLYPFGNRRCALMCMYSPLSTFAYDHGGRFPCSKNGAFDALSQLYPEYTPCPEVLAGISGNRKALAECIKLGKAFSEIECGWVYFQGMSVTDNPKIAILWDRIGGVSGDGRRDLKGRHPVLFIDGDIQLVKKEQWDLFVKQQQELRFDAERHRNHGSESH